MAESLTKVVRISMKANVGDSTDVLATDAPYPSFIGVVLGLPQFTTSHGGS